MAETGHRICCGMPGRTLVSVVDDDSPSEILRICSASSGLWASRPLKHSSRPPSGPRCLILDIAMPGMSGLELQDELRRRQLEIPIVFITARRDDTLRPRLLERGAVEVLVKPFSDAALLDAVTNALEVN